MTDRKVKELEQLLEKMWREYVAQFKDEDAEVYKSDLVLYHAIRAALIERDKLKSALESMVNQFAYVGQDKNGPTLCAIGFSSLREAFDALGWPSPKSIPERKCQAEGCLAEATCGMPTKDGYKRLCYNHYKEAADE